MNRPILACAFFALATTALVAQDQSQSSPYQGTSNPPPDDTIITSEQQPPIPKPPAGHPMQQAPAAQPAPTQPAPQTMNARQNSDPVPQTYGDGTDEGIVGVAPSAPGLTTRAASVDPDSDIVHPAPLPPGTLGEGTLIRIRLLNEVSSSFAEQGEPFRSRVAATSCRTARSSSPPAQRSMAESPKFRPAASADTAPSCFSLRPSPWRTAASSNSMRSSLPLPDQTCASGLRASSHPAHGSRRTAMNMLASAVVEWSSARCSAARLGCSQAASSVPEL